MYSTWFGTEIQGLFLKNRKCITYTFTPWCYPGPSFYVKHFVRLFSFQEQQTKCQLWTVSHFWIPKASGKTGIHRREELCVGHGLYHFMLK